MSHLYNESFYTDNKSYFIILKLSLKDKIHSYPKVTNICTCKRRHLFCYDMSKTLQW